MKKTISVIALSAFALASSSVAMAAGHAVQDGDYGYGVYAGGHDANYNGIGPFFGPGGGQVTNDTTSATPTIIETFTLKGSVAKDCSYYGGTTSAHTINLGAIGVKNGDTETTATAFTQAAPFNFDIQTTSAGCNFDNTVSLTKSANGLVNATPGGYDSSEFTANIPYKATVGVQKAVNAGATGTGIYHSFVVDVAASTGNMKLGAWRSSLTLNVNAPGADARPGRGYLYRHHDVDPRG
ncbi:MAG: hypothetical protein JWQ16_1916 [Novosphingobium sp.]|nr:hypothetical protein [Novosphingobium sp.]